jgi:hypothetical protein
LTSIAVENRYRLILGGEALAGELAMMSERDLQLFRLTTVAVLSGLLIGAAIADDGQTSAGASTTQQAPVASSSDNAFPQQPPSSYKPGFLHQLGVWWDQGIGDFNNKMKNAKDKFDDLGSSQPAKDAATATQDALKNAADAVVRLPTTRMFELHDKCQMAANGAPDCPTAANNACRGKGFSTGKPMGISTSQVCSPQALLSGRTPGPADCHDETYILGVVCQ